MISHVMSAENWDILELLVQVSLNIMKRRIRYSTRRKEKVQKVVNPISCGKKRMRAPHKILSQSQMMNMLTYV